MDSLGHHQDNWFFTATYSIDWSFSNPAQDTLVSNDTTSRAVTFLLNNIDTLQLTHIIVQSSRVPL